MMFHRDRNYSFSFRGRIKKKKNLTRSKNIYRLMDRRILSVSLRIARNIKLSSSDRFFFLSPFLNGTWTLRRIIREEAIKPVNDGGASAEGGN